MFDAKLGNYVFYLGTLLFPPILIRITLMRPRGALVVLPRPVLVLV